VSGEIAYGRGTAPCGHVGFVVVGTFIRCAYGCKDDSKPVPHCPECGSIEIEPFEVVVDWWTGHKAMKTHCLPHGHVW